VLCDHNYDIINRASKLGVVTCQQLLKMSGALLKRR